MRSSRFFGFILFLGLILFMISSTNALKNLKTLAVVPNKAGAGAVTNLKPPGGKSQIPDCCICAYLLPSIPFSIGPSARLSISFSIPNFPVVVVLAL
jgi:hypothetical protein